MGDRIKLSERMKENNPMKCSEIALKAGLARKGKTTWSKGLTAEIDERVRKSAEIRKGQKHPSMSGENNPSKRPEVRAK
jgi:hypothetical protein